MIVLPTAKVKPRFVDPRVTVLYSFPKVGKTPCLAGLPNCLILDLEGGTDLIDAVKMNIIGLAHKRAGETPEQIEARHAKGYYYLSEVLFALNQHNPYSFIALDTLTILANWCEEDATYMYMDSTIGKNFNKWSAEEYQKSNGTVVLGALKPRNQWASVLTLPKGAGYMWLWKSFTKWLDYLRALGVPLLLTGHVQLSTITKKTGQEVENKDIELAGKLRTIATALMADAIGYMYRDGNKNFVSFKSQDEIRCGCRIPRLEGREILLSEMTEDKTLKVYWENIFESLQVPS